MKESKLVFLVKITITAFSMLYSLDGQSQLKAAGIEGGIAFSKLNVQNAENETNRNGYTIGVYGEWKLFPKTGIETGIYYAAKGTRFEVVRATGAMQVNELNINYLLLPVMLKYHFLNYFSVGSGVYGGYLLSVNFSRETNNINSFETLNSDNFRTFDTGMMIGLSFKINPIQISYIYTNSFVDQLSSQLAERILGEARNSSSQISIGFNFTYKSGS